MHCLPLLILCLVLVISIASGASRASRALPVVTVTDAHGQVKSIQTFLWVHRVSLPLSPPRQAVVQLAEVKDRVQMKQKIPKDRMILWYIPKDRDGYDVSPCGPSHAIVHYKQYTDFTG